MAQRLLGRDTGNISQPFSRLLFLQSGQQRRSVKIADSFLFCSPSIGANIQGPIEDISAATEDAGKLLRLGVGWVESEAVSYFHTNSIYYVMLKCQIF